MIMPLVPLRNVSMRLQWTKCIWYSHIRPQFDDVIILFGRENNVGDIFIIIIYPLHVRLNLAHFD